MTIDFLLQITLKLIEFDNQSLTLNRYDKTNCKQLENQDRAIFYFLFSMF